MTYTDQYFYKLIKAGKMPPRNAEYDIRHYWALDRYWKDCKRHLYFAEAKGGVVDGLIKIGTASDIYTRVMGLQHEMSVSLRLMAIGASAHIGGFVLERYLHMRFLPDLRYKTEWFAPSFELYGVIDACNKNPLAVMEDYLQSEIVVEVNRNNRPLGRLPRGITTPAPTPAADAA